MSKLRPILPPSNWEARAEDLQQHPEYGAVGYHRDPAASVPALPTEPPLYDPAALRPAARRYTLNQIAGLLGLSLYKAKEAVIRSGAAKFEGCHLYADGPDLQAVVPPDVKSAVVPYEDPRTLPAPKGTRIGKPELFELLPYLQPLSKQQRAEGVCPPLVVVPGGFPWDWGPRCLQAKLSVGQQRRIGASSYYLEECLPFFDATWASPHENAVRYLAACLSYEEQKPGARTDAQRAALLVTVSRYAGRLAARRTGSWGQHLMTSRDEFSAGLAAAQRAYMDAVDKLNSCRQKLIPCLHADFEVPND